MLLVCIMTCKKYSHLWPTIRERLGKTPHLFFVGGAEHTYLDGDILHINCNDGYDGLCEKVLKLLHWLNTNPAAPQWTHILKVDDWDTYITEEIVVAIPYKDKDYAGPSIQVRKPSETWHFRYITDPSCYWYNRPFTDSWYPYHHGGDGYILSHKAVSTICNEVPIGHISEYYYKELYEDMMVGRLLARVNIHPTVCPLGIKSRLTS